MIELYVYTSDKSGRAYGLIKAPTLIKNGEATFFCPRYGVELGDAFSEAMMLSYTHGRKLGITGDIALFKTKFPDVKGSVSFAV